MGLLESKIHDMETSPALGAILEEFERRQLTEDLSAVLNPYELANIRLSRKQFKEKTLVPSELIKASSIAITKSSNAWKEARETSDFSKFAPSLEEQIRLLRQIVSYKMKGGIYEEAVRINKEARARLGLSDDDDCFKGYYQVVLDGYEPGFKDSHLEELFSDLKQHIIPLISRIKAKNFQHDNKFLKGEFNIEKQAEFSTKLPKMMGFDMDSGRLDISTHPFCNSVHATDVRFTTRFNPNSIQEGISNTVHEAGHAIFEQGLHKEYLDTPVSLPLSDGIHESQSLLW
jgi:carboxypeptidase Taq